MNRLGRALITGAAGFVGGHLVDRCSQEQWDIVSVDAPQYFVKRPSHQGRNFGTIIDREELFPWLKEHGHTLSVIYHLGACTDTSNIDENYLRQINLEYSQKLWQYASENQIPFYYASSSATYGAGEDGFDDDESQLTKLAPLNPYGRSKHQFDLWAWEQHQLGKAPAQWAGFKFFNVYGTGEEHKGNMASYVFQALHQLKSNGAIRLFKSYRDGWDHGQQKRDFIFVQDVVDVMIFAFEKPITQGIFNLGTGEAQSYKALAQMIFRQTGCQENIEFFDMPEAIKDRFQYFTEAKMERLRQQGYDKPFTSLEEGVKRLLENDKP